MGLETFYGKGPGLLWAGSRAARGKILSGIPNCLNYCEIFIAYVKFKVWPRTAYYNLAARRLETSAVKVRAELLHTIQTNFALLSPYLSHSLSPLFLLFNLYLLSLQRYKQV